VKETYAFEVLPATGWHTPTESPFIPNVFVDISGQINTKMDALREYQMEMREKPHSRSLENVFRLAEFRGNCVGVDAAEGLSLIRSIQ
jgi:LmbE family N-acetylglucosaminyl deacetylase